MLRINFRLSYPTIQESAVVAFNDSYPPPSPSNYTPVLGDTFSTIAALFAQNSAYASTIAMMNGLNAGDVPQPGEQVFIPQFLSNYNNYATLPPSGQIISKLYGSLYPVLQTIQPPVRNHKHSFWGGFFGGIGEIFLAIVAVVVCYFVPEITVAIAPFIVGTLGVTAATVLLPIIEAAMFAMVGLTQEELAVQMGLAAHFSLGQALLDAFEDGESAGLGEIASAGMTIEELGLMVLAVGVANIEEQFLAMDLGLQKGFSLREVASAITTQLAIEGLDLAFGISSAITIGETAGKVLENDLEQEVVTVGVQTLVDKEIAHQAFNLQFTIEDAIGTVAGEFMVQEAQIAAMQQYQQAQQAAQQAAQNASQQQSPANAMSKYGMYRSNAAQSGGAASSAYGSGNTVVTSVVDQPVISDGDMLTSLGVATDNPTLTLLGAMSPDAQSPESQFVSNSASNLLFFTSGGSNATSSKLVLPSTQDEQDNLWMERAHIILGLAGFGTAYGEIANDMREFWLGMNNKWYSIDWGGNQYTGARSLVLEGADAAVEAFHMTGVGLYTVDTLVNIYEIGDDIYNRNLVAAGPTGFDIIMGGVGIAAGGWLGVGLAGIYFGPKWIINNWSTVQTAFENTSEVDEENQEISGQSIYGRPKF